MAGPFLVESGVEPSEEGLGPALMMRLLLELPFQSGYFRPLAEQPSMARALWSTLRELRLAGIRGEMLKTEWFSSPAKHKELVALISAYEMFLKERKSGDTATVYEEALQHPSWCPIQPEDCWTELPETIWQPLQRRLLELLAGERIRALAIEVCDYSVPRRLLAQGTERTKPDPSDNAIAFLISPPATSKKASVGSDIHLFSAGGREAEIDEVFRRIFGSGLPLDQIEIACPSDAHVSLIWEKALRHSWPVTLGPGIPAVFTRPGRALIGLCDWIETDFSASHFRRLLQSGDLSVENDLGFTAGQAARQLARSGAGWGRATYSLSFARLLRNYEAKAADQEASEYDQNYAKEKIKLTTKVRDWISGLVASVPEPDHDRKVALQSVVTSTLEFLQRVAARSSALDHRAAAALVDYIGELRALGPFLCGLSEALRFVRERVDSLQVACERPRPGHLYVCNFSQCGYAGRRHLFVVGLEEGRVFPAPTEDAVLLDSERKRISNELQASQDRIDESVYAFLSRVASSPASVTFSYSCRDTREYRETYASWVMLQGFRLQQRNPKLSYTDMKAALGEAKSAMPEDRDTAICRGEWWLRSVFNTESRGVHAIDDNFPALAQGRAAQAMRQSSEFTEFDGYVPEAGPILDPCSPANTFSVTELEAASQCPFGFFLKRGLGVHPVDEIERDKDVWLDPLTRGSVLHELYAALLRRARDANRRPNAEDRAWLIALAQQRLKELSVEMPPATPEIFDRESKDFIADIELFIEAESNDSSSTPIGFEVSFGRSPEGYREPLARREPIELNLGDGLVLRIAGRIDRIDKVGKTAFEVLDYKTGNYWRDGWKGIFDGGRRLQHALYGLAAVELLKVQYINPKVEAGVYYFSTHNGRQERHSFKAPAKEDVAEVMRNLRSVIAKGEFSQSPNEKDCKFCSLARGCGMYAEGQLEAKLQDPKLDDYRRLSEHE
jgi:RecB family exonuclease